MYDDYNGNFRQDELVGTLTPNVGNNAERNGQKVCMPVIGLDRIEKHQNGRRFKEDGDSSFALTSQDRHGVAIEVIGNYEPSGHSAGNIMSTEGGGVQRLWTITGSHRQSRSRSEKQRRAVTQLRGGARQRQPHDAGIENKKRTSRGRYGEHA